MENEEGDVDNQNASKATLKFLEINVGGKLFACSTATLLRFPDTSFDSLLDPKVDDATEILRDPEGHIFLDRDPDMFMFVLEFLRNGRLSVASYSVDLLERLDAEAKFFRIQQLQQEVSESRKRLDPNFKEKSMNIASDRPQSVARPQQLTQAEEPTKRATIGFIEYAERLAVLSTVGREPHTQVSLTGKMSHLEGLLRLISIKRPQLKSLLDDLREKSHDFDEVTCVLLSPALLKRAAFDRLDCFRIWLANVLIPFASLPITVGDANSKRYMWPLLIEPSF